MSTWNEQVKRNKQIVTWYFQDDLSVRDIRFRLVSGGWVKQISRQAVWVIIKRDGRKYGFGE